MIAFVLLLKLFSESIVLGNTKTSQAGQCGGLVSTFTAAFSQRSSLWLLQRSPTCYIWSTWTVRLLQQSRLILWCPLHLFPWLFYCPLDPGMPCGYLRNARAAVCGSYDGMTHCSFPFPGSYKINATNMSRGFQWSSPHGV